LPLILANFSTIMARLLRIKLGTERIPRSVSITDCRHDTSLAKKRSNITTSLYSHVSIILRRLLKI
jgi:hypothetical protein